MASFSLYRLVNIDRQQYRLVTKFTFQLKQLIKFTPTIDIAIVPLYKQRHYHFIHQSIVTICEIS